MEKIQPKNENAKIQKNINQKQGEEKSDQKNQETKIPQENSNDQILETDLKDKNETEKQIQEESTELQKKKKKKKNKNKKKKTNFKELAEKYQLTYSITEETLKNFSSVQDNSQILNLGSWSKMCPLQTTPPSISILKQYPTDESLPHGVKVPYKDQLAFRFNDKEYLARDEFIAEKIYSLRRSAEVHRQVRKHCQNTIKPGQSMLEIVKNIESTLAYVVEKEGLERGQAFPTGCSLNNCAAHYTPNYGDNTIFTKNDVCKIDFGVHVKGYLIDSAFTVAFDPQFKPLLEAVKEATMIGIKTAGIDVRLCDIGEAIQEVMESFEVEINGKNQQVLCVRNLCGHTIDKYRVHGGKSVPIVKGGPQTRMEEGEIYAIETFGTTGKGYVRDDMECSHYMKEYGNFKVGLKSKTKQLLNFIDQNFSTLAFCRRWLDDGGMTNHILQLKELVRSGVVTEYPPLCDISKSYVAQYEHTFLLKPSGKEVMSIGEDY